LVKIIVFAVLGIVDIDVDAEALRLYVIEFSETLLGRLR